jgi:peroxiredoxin Q/BCP
VVVDFRDEIDKFETRGVIVLGVNMDGIESHRKFKAKYNLPFPLLSDPTGKVCEKYGVIKEKTMYGKTFKGIERSTFIIDEKTMITHAYRGVRVEGHVRKILDALSA